VSGNAFTSTRPDLGNDNIDPHRDVARRFSGSAELQPAPRALRIFAARAYAPRYLVAPAVAFGRGHRPRGVIFQPDQANAVANLVIKVNFRSASENSDNQRSTLPLLFSSAAVQKTPRSSLPTDKRSPNQARL
jgi:hypothetical protein